MEPLIKVTYDNDRITVLARDLHEFLELEERFSKWFDRMIGYGFIENEDYTPYQKVHPQNKQEITDYQLTIEMAKEIAMIQRNEKGKQARQYFIECEKQLQQPKSMEDILIYQLQEMKRLKEQSEQATAIATEAKETANGIRDIVAIQVTDWRKDTNSILNKIAVSLGGGDSYKMVKEEAYKTLQDKIHVDLHRRLTNLKSRMALEGVAKSTINKNSILDVIERDRKVLECYISVVKNMAIKYGVDLPSEMKVGDHA